MPIAPADVPYVRDTQHRLNAMLAAVAAGNGAELVDWYTASIGHDACKTKSARWVEPAFPAVPAAPVHPNRRGMEGAASAVVDELLQGAQQAAGAS
jgi:hypothetical protein